MTTITALLTNKACGYPTRGAKRRRKPTILACLHQTANATATAIGERNYANRAGSWGPFGNGVHRPRRHDRPRHRSCQVRGLEPGRRGLAQHEDPDDRHRGRVGREHERVGARVDRVLWLGHRALHRRPVRERRPAGRRGIAGTGDPDQPQHRGRARRINGVSRRSDPWPPATREARVKRVISRANALLRPPIVTVTVM
jgi:hypothetical protein